MVFCFIVWRRKFKYWILLFDFFFYKYFIICSIGNVLKYIKFFVSKVSVVVCVYIILYILMFFFFDFCLILYIVILYDWIEILYVLLYEWLELELF